MKMKGKNINNEYKLGEIYWVNFKGEGNIQNGKRPAIIIQNNKGNKYSPTVLVIPLTTRRKSKLPTHIYFKAGMYGLLRDSIAQCEGQRLVLKEDLDEFIGCLDHRGLSMIAKGCLISTPLLNFLAEDELCELKEHTTKYN